MVSAAILAFAAGVLALQLQPALPELGWPWPLAAAAAMLAAVLRAGGVQSRQADSLWRIAAPCLAFCTGFMWAAGFAQQRLADRLAPHLEGRDLQVVGVVASLPAINERSVRFEFDIESAENVPERLPGRVMLSWYRAPQWSWLDDTAAALEDPGGVHPGERWLLTVRLRRPHGNLNPHGFDYEAWLLERGIGATGYVRPRGEQRKLGLRNSLADRVEQAREAVRARFKRVLGDAPAAGILVALAVGDQRSITAQEWRVFARTGVTHLMSISGLHVTLVSGLAAWLVAAFWRRLPHLVLWLPARKAAALAAIAAALGYTLLAGFAVPAQRTFYMVSIVAAALWFGRIAAPARVLALALAVVLLADPWAVLAAGFWLSFGAVALIFYVAQGWSGASHAALQWLRIQWAITIGLAPATVFLFAQVSLVGPLANAVAIPLVSAVVTPLALGAALLPFDAPLHLAEWLMRLLLGFLEWCSALPLAVWQRHVPPLWAMLLALAGVAWLLMPRGMPSRWAGALLMLPAFALPVPAPAPGEAWVTTLDVGQGLAVVVRTAGHTLLYDAGPMLGPDSDSGERIVVPYLRATGVARLDAVIVTHNDQDHAGGALSVLQNVSADRVRSSLRAGHPILEAAPGAQRCERGEHWEWDGVRFAFLHPDAADYAAALRSNNLSCVLQVSAGGTTMLLTGDIERAAEAALVARSGAAGLRAQALLVPHHGSRTSSSAEFLAAVGPGVAVVPVGYRNRFGHPSREVLERYALAGARVRRTDREGAVTVGLAPSGATVSAERETRRRYWHQ